MSRSYTSSHPPPSASMACSGTALPLTISVVARERKHSEDRGVDGEMGSVWILWRLAGGVWSRLSWLRIGAGGGLL
jgi:hypothetical protein